MNSYERFLATMRGELPDRTPVACWLGLPYLLKTTPGARTYTDLFDLWVDDPRNTIVARQEELGLDPMVLTNSLHWGEVLDFPARIFSWPDAALAGWQERREVLAEKSRHKVVRRIIRTPEGELDYTYRLDDHARTMFEHVLKREEDLNLLRFMPDPALLNVDRLTAMVQKVEKRAVFHHVTPGVWDEACQLRGLTQISLDLYDRPAWVHRLMHFIADRQVRLMRRLAESGIETINYNETWVGFGLSPRSYRDFILPYDAEVVQAIHDAGMLVSYHNCGKASKLLELHADIGADALETLTPRSRAGDVYLADAKQRVGRRITLFGGFNEDVLSEGEPADVEAEVRRCLAAAAEGGRYILRTAGQIMAARPGNIEAMTAAVRKLGVY
jgi:uroporphyrinogen-III decarboxylase